MGGGRGNELVEQGSANPTMACKLRDVAPREARTNPGPCLYLQGRGAW